MAVVRGGITVKPHVQAFADACQAATGADSYGTYNGHSPPEGPTQALDVFNPKTENGYRLQDAIAQFAIKNQKRFGVRYAIKWNPAGKDFIWNIERAAEGWRAMATRDHSDHVHITFYATAAAVPEEPDPVPVPQGDLHMLTFRYIYDGLDWVFDGPSELFFQLNDERQITEVLDPLGVKALGKVSEATHRRYSEIAAAAGFKG